MKILQKAQETASKSSLEAVAPLNAIATKEPSIEKNEILEEPSATEASSTVENSSCEVVEAAAPVKINGTLKKTDEWYVSKSITIDEWYTFRKAQLLQFLAYNLCLIGFRLHFFNFIFKIVWNFI